jgi:hypothetical protein
MPTATRQYRRVAGFILLLFLLFTIDSANAFWCTGAENIAHLESNAVGECWGRCHSEGSDRQTLSRSLAKSVQLKAGGDNCVDTPIHSYLTLSDQFELSQPDFTVELSSWEEEQSARPSIDVADWQRQRIIAQQLPPPQSLIALRTVVLLH